ncbi:MAG: glucuronyl hydrolase, partial [Actinomycetota bacterium]|nr:glucuronyl hydrolase [Actinomycetota bacterium]
MRDAIWTDAIDHMMVRIDDTAARVREGFPDYADPQTGRWTASQDGSWTGGFWNGMLWLALATTKEQKYLDWAERWTELLRPRVQSENIFRSFLFYYGAALGDILVGNSLAKEMGLLGARGLATLYNPNARAIPLGREAEAVSDVVVGPGDGNVEGVQATSLLIWAAREPGDEKLFEIGIQLALRFI